MSDLTSRLGLWLRWAARDGRRRWAQVLALALVLALGVGTWSALRGTARWREQSNDLSFAALNYHDLSLELPDGGFVDEGTLLDELGRFARTPDGAAVEITGMEERLRVATQVDASTADATVLAPGLLIGAEFGDTGPLIDAFDVRAGDGIEPDAAVLDVHFAEGNDLPATGEIRLSGDRPLRYSAHVLAPTEFFVISERGGLFAGDTFAVVYAPLDLAQELSGRTGQVNGLVATVGAGVGAEVAATVQAHFDARAPNLGVTVRLGTEERVFRVLYDDIENDQRFYNIFATLIFLGAAFGAFNLARRMVESQRHEIGVAMALGVPVPQIAARPLLVAAEIALLGVLLGVGVGVGLGEALKSLFAGFLPLPIWRTSFPLYAYWQAAAIGVVVPLAGVAWPVWRAVRASPVETLSPRYRSVPHRLVPRVGRGLRLRGSVVARYPIRNLLRSLQRTFLTTLAIGAAVTALLSVLGMVDSFRAALDRGEQAILAGNPGRMTVDLDRPVPASSDVVQQIVDDATTADATLGLRVGAQLLAGDAEPLDVVVEARDLQSSVWRPRIDPVAETGPGGGLVLAAKAMADLGLDVGDAVVLRHPAFTGRGSVEVVETPITVAGVHDVPFRPQVFMTAEQATLFGVRGFVNLVDVIPAPGAGRDDVKRALFPLAGVTSVQGVAESTEALRELIDEFLSFLLVVEGVTVALAVLVAFNATSIAIDERRREHATMLAFGLPQRTVLRMTLVENLIVGLLGAVVGLIAGVLVVRWIIEVSIPDIVPDLTILTRVSAGSLLAGIVASVFASALAAAAMVFRIRSMNLPATLRVME